jgi:hypothetical protein
MAHKTPQQYSHHTKGGGEFVGIWQGFPRLTENFNTLVVNLPSDFVRIGNVTDTVSHRKPRVKQHRYNVGSKNDEKP